MYKDGKREENEVWAKEDNIDDGKNRKRERRDSTKNVKSGEVCKTETYYYIGTTIN